MKKVLITAILAAASLFSLAAHAGNFYAGADIGGSHYASSVLTKTNATSFGLSGGYAYTKNFAIEAAHTDLGRVSAGAVSVKARETDLAAIGTYNINDKVALYGRLGYAFLDASGTTRHDSVTYGAGASYHLTDAIDLRGGLNRYNLTGADHVINLNGGLRYNFR